jgi:hypothetical protein
MQVWSLLSFKGQSYRATIVNDEDGRPLSVLVRLCMESITIWSYL